MEARVAELCKTTEAKPGSVHVFYLLQDLGLLQHLLVDSGVKQKTDTGVLPDGAWYLIQASASYPGGRSMTVPLVMHRGSPDDRRSSTRASLFRCQRQSVRRPGRSGNSATPFPSSRHDADSVNRREQTLTFPLSSAERGPEGQCCGKLPSKCKANLPENHISGIMAA